MINGLLLNEKEKVTTRNTTIMKGKVNMIDEYTVNTQKSSTQKASRKVKDKSSKIFISTTSS